MAIGKNSRKSSTRSSIRAPKFLDKSNGFYDRFDEPEARPEVEEVTGGAVEVRGNGMEDGSTNLVHRSGPAEKEDTDVFDFHEGMMEDDGETLLCGKASRRSSRWRRSSRRKQKEGKVEEDAAQEERPSLGPEVTAVMIEVELEKMRTAEEEIQMTGKGKEPALVHFPVKEDMDDQVLIREKKRAREEEEEEEMRRMKREQEQGMKAVKRVTVKDYRKALDRAFRRGWEAFITNLYSVTLTPVTSSSMATSPSLKKKHQHNVVLAEFR